MPYIRLYSREVPLETKRLIARELIKMTLDAFQLRPEERDRITVQFVPPAEDRDFSSRNALKVEVSATPLTPKGISAFVAAATPMLKQAVGKPAGVLASMVECRADSSRQIAFQFNQLSGADRQAAGTHVVLKAA